MRPSVTAAFCISTPSTLRSYNEAIMLPTPHDRHERIVPVAFLRPWFGRVNRHVAVIGRARCGPREALAITIGERRTTGRPGCRDGAAPFDRAIRVGCRGGAGTRPRRRDGAAVAGAGCCGRRHGFTGGRRSRQSGEGQQQHGNEQDDNSGDTHGVVLSLQIADAETIIARFGIAR